MPTIEPVVFARIMMLPAALREDVLECVSSTHMGERQVEELIARMRQVAEERQKDGRSVSLAPN